MQCQETIAVSVSQKKKKKEGRAEIPQPFLELNCA
jgi:hypothetical protein